MGLFNSTLAVGTCPNCGEVVGREVQFAFANTRQLHYSVGEMLEWSNTGNDVGRPGLGEVVVDGYYEACPNCGYEEGVCEVYITDDVLTGVAHWSGKFDFSNGPDFVRVQ